VWGQARDAARVSGLLEDQLARVSYHRKYRLVAALIGGAPEILRSTDRQRARGLELAEELLQASADRIGRLMCDGLDFEDQLPCGSKAADLLLRCRIRILDNQGIPAPWQQPSL